MATLPGWVRRYAWTALAIGAACAVITVGPGILRGEGLGIVFLAAVFAATVKGGPGPGLASIPLSLLAANALFMTPRWDFSRADRLWGQALFTGISLLVVWLVTHRRRVERALREGEERLRAFHETSLDGFAVFKAVREKGRIVDLQYTYANPTAERIVGKGPLVGRRLLEVLPGHAGVDGLLERYAKVVETGRPHDIEFFYEGEGIRAWFRNMSVKLGDGVAMSFSDITERKRNEEALRTSTSLLETIVTHMPASACLIRGSDLRLLSVNPAYQAIAPGKTMVGRTLEELWPETGRSFSEVCRRVLETGEPFHADDERYTIRRYPDGPLETAYFSWSLHPVQLPGHGGWGILNTAWETTERVLTGEALRRSEARLRRLYESNLIGVLYYRLDEALLDANDYFLSLVGYSREDLREGRIDFSRITPPEYRALDEEAVALLKATGEAIPYEEEYIRKDGSRVPVLIGAASLDEAREEGIAFVLDITQRKRFEQELRALNETLEERVRQRTTELERSQQALKQSERLAVIGEVMTGLSHESRNALQRSLAGIEMLERRLKDQPALQRLVLEMRKAHNDLRHVYENVQEFARPILLKRQAMDVALAWRSAWERLRPRDGRNATLREETEGVDRKCEIDSLQLERVFGNLLDNALAASPDPVEVQIRCLQFQTDTGPWLRISVRDNGPGVVPEQRDRLFHPFYTTKTKGTGLGLAIVKRIVEAHGGRVSVGAEPGDGLEIVIELPKTIAVNRTATAQDADTLQGIPANLHH